MSHAGFARIQPGKTSIASQIPHSPEKRISMKDGRYMQFIGSSVVIICTDHDAALQNH